MKKLLIAAVFFVVHQTAGAQNPVTKILPLMADSVASGNNKDVLKNFFQLALDNLIGPNKELKFSSNPFAVMAKMNPELLIDSNYYRYRHLRNLNVAFAGKLDTSFRFNGFTSSVNYAIINQRDITVSREFAVAAYKANDEFNRLNNAANSYVARLPLGPERSRIRGILSSIFTDSSSVRFNQLDDSTQKLLVGFAKAAKAQSFLDLVKTDPGFNIRNASQKSYQDLKKLFQNKLLWTAGVSDTTYSNQFFFSNVVLSTQLVKGISDPSRNSNLEINLNAAYNFVDDSSRSGRDLKRNVFHAATGLNWVLKTKGTQQSVAELMLGGSYYRVFSGGYKSERQEYLNIEGTLRIRIFNDIWVPLQIRYDPRSGNILGFLNVRANFSGISKLIKN